MLVQTCSINQRNLDQIQDQFSQLQGQVNQQHAQTQQDYEA